MEGHSWSINWGGGEVGEIMYRMILKAVLLYMCMTTHVVENMEATHQTANSDNLYRVGMKGKEEIFTTLHDYKVSGFDASTHYFHFNK